MFTFKIISEPCSANMLYMTIGRSRILSKAGRTYKVNACAEIVAQIQHEIDLDPAFIDQLKALKGKRLTLRLSFHSLSWLLKNRRSIRKKDISSYEKATVDSMTDAIKQYVPGFDDSQIFGMQLLKIDDESEYISLELDTI
jgi:hypothetical protein